MQDLVWRCRVSADRHGRTFSYLLLTPADAPRVHDVIVRRLRATDDVGRCPREIDRQSALLVLLPDTTRVGATKVAADLVARRVCHEGTVTVRTYSGVGGGGAGGRPAAVESDAAPGVPRPQPVWKRVLDVVVAGLAVLAVAPLVLLIAVAIRLDSRGPVVFRQQRAGRGGRPFTILKFRTMRADAEAMRHVLASRSEQDGPAFKLRRDPRVTRVGLLLRATSLDELPQLLNVLRGDMSLVGPRPLPVSESDACLAWHRRRLDVAPGLTCIWQVHGRSRVGFDEWMRMDLRYVNRTRGRLAALHDLTLLVKTVPALFLKRGF